MNLKINTTSNKISLSERCKDRITALLNPDLSPSKPKHKFKMVATCTPNDNCGDVSAYLKCESCEKTYPVDHHCDRLECPICYKTAAARIGKRSSAKIRSVQDALLAFINPENAKDVYGRPSPNTHLDAGFSEQRAKQSRIVNTGGVRHLTISVSKKEYDKWEEFSNTQMVNAFDDHLAKYCKRIIASEFIYHPHRI